MKSKNPLALYDFPVLFIKILIYHYLSEIACLCLSVLLNASNIFVQRDLKKWSEGQTDRRKWGALKKFFSLLYETHNGIR